MLGCYASNDRTKLGNIRLRRTTISRRMEIEDYGFIGNMRTCALVGANGSMDWLCLPRFDSNACLAALLGDEKNGCWRISPRDGNRNDTP